MPERTAWLMQARRLRKAAEILLRAAQEIENNAPPDAQPDDSEPDPPPPPDPPQTTEL